MSAQSNGNSNGNSLMMRWLAIVLGMAVVVIGWLASNKASCDRVNAVEKRQDRQEDMLDRIYQTVQEIDRKLAVIEREP